VRSEVQKPQHQAAKSSPFNRSEFELFAHHTMGTGISGEAVGDRLLLWATNPKFKGGRIRFMEMKTMRKKAVKLNIPDGVRERDFSEPADGCQRMVFFYRSLYDAVKQLLRSSRFAGKQHTEFERVYTPGQKRKLGAINRGEMYKISQKYAGSDVSPLSVFLSSDTTVICKKMGDHPIISECLSHLVCLYVTVYVCICSLFVIYESVFICILFKCVCIVSDHALLQCL
jgi:hypothetical protein